MSLTEATPSATDLLDLPLDRLLANANQRDCESYALRLLDRDQEPPKGSGPWKAQILLAFIMGLRLCADDDSEPLVPGPWFGPHGPDVLTTAQIEALSAWLPSIEDPEIAARVADVLWVTRRPRNHQDGRLAVTKYLEAAERSACVDGRWSGVLPRLQRAHSLACRFKMESEVEDLANQLLTGGGGLDHGPWGARLMVFLLDRGLGNAREFAAQAETRAQQHEDEAAKHPRITMGLPFAREYWSAAALCRVRLGESEAGAELRQRAARTYIVEANHARDNGEPPVEAHFLRDAVTALRQAGAKRGEVEDIILRARDAQRATHSVVISVTVDVTESVRESRARVRELPLDDAIRELAFHFEMPSLDTIRSAARQLLVSSPLAQIAPILLTSQDRVVKHLPALAESDEGDEQLLRWRMWEELRALRGEAAARIRTARDQIVFEHQPRLADVERLLSASWLVPAGHEQTIAHGLLRGLYGDDISASHILVPQLENGLREYIERELGKPMIRQEADGTQMVGLLTRILDLPELAAVLGNDVIFDLQGLLVRQESENLRNNLSHGLLGDGGLAVSGPYVWWLCLRLCLMPTPIGSRQDG